MQWFIFQHWMTLLQQMKDSENWTFFLTFFLATLCANCTPIISQLRKNKGSLVLGMVTHFGMILILFFTLDLIFLLVFLQLAWLSKKFPLMSKEFVLPFYINTNPILDNIVQLPSSLVNNSAHGSFITHLFWNFFVTSYICFLISTLDGIGKFSSWVWKNSQKDILTS